MLGTAGAIPFSVLTLPELLLGELGAEPGALLHAESVVERHVVIHTRLKSQESHGTHLLTGVWAAAHQHVDKLQQERT